MPRRRTGGRSLVRSVVHLHGGHVETRLKSHQIWPSDLFTPPKNGQVAAVFVKEGARTHYDTRKNRRDRLAGDYRTARRGAPKRRSSRSTSCCTRREGWCADSRRLRRPALGRSTRPSAPPSEAAWIGSCGSSFAPRRGDGVRRPSSRPPSRGRCGRAARAHEQRVGQDDRPTCRDRLRLLEATT